MRELTASSPAKINLTLRVLGRREDGYHEIVSLVARVGLADTIRIAPRADDQIVVTCDDASIPVDERNLVFVAAAAMREQFGSNGGVDIDLQKRIPVGAGLGGGSSNAATVLAMLNRMWRLGLAPDPLARLAAGIGSDVPLFLASPVCLLTGRGERVAPLPAGPGGWAVLVLPNILLSTPHVYRAWRPAAAGSGIPVTDGGIEARRMAERWSRLDSLEAATALCVNDLTLAARSVNSEFDRFVARMEGAAGRSIHMTGSGSALFSLFDERGAADAFARRMRDAGAPRTEVIPFAPPAALSDGPPGV
jgi:4-diphosphocytidyl-2-C-methyl-D-erythritol kinase